MDDVQTIFILILMGLALILAFVATTSVGVILTALTAKVWRTFVTLDRDPRVLAFGQSATGNYLHQVVASQLPKVDEADDPAVKAALNLPVVVNLYRWGLIDGKVVSGLMTKALGLTVELLDGQAVETTTTRTINISPTSTPVSFSSSSGTEPPDGGNG